MLRKNRFRVLLAAVAGLCLLVPGLATSDDSVLFSTIAPPNVVLVVDNSGSMNHVVWHPQYDPAVDYTINPDDGNAGNGDEPGCNFWDNTRQYNANSWSTDTNGPSSNTDTTFRAGTYTRCGNTREIFFDADVDAAADSTRWMGAYLNWYFSDDADAWAAEVVTANNGVYSSCLGGGTYNLYRRSRVTAGKNILREVICQVNQVGAVRFGIAQFRRGGDPEGGHVVVPANDYLDGTGSPNVYALDGVTQSHGDHLEDAISNLTGEAWTPLAETLFQVYTYFMSRAAADRPSGASSGTFPEYEYETDHDSGSGGEFNSGGPPAVPDSPVQWACQKNFVIIITDGEPTRDDFDTDPPEDAGFSNFMNLIGDFNADGETETGYSSEGTLWLDDIAKFMQETDFRPDIPAHEGQEQVIDVYTVGFTTTAAANAILTKTAAQGNGQFRTSNDPEALASDIVAVLNDILQKAQGFTAATVPATRTALGGRFYNTLFVPSGASGYWEGHLKSWTITAAGEIEDLAGNCALDDPGAPATCLSGPFLDAAVPFWDAGDELQTKTPAGRNLFTSHLVSGISRKVAFNTGNMTSADMNVTVADIPNYDFGAYPLPTTADEMKDVVVQNVRGCELGDTTGTCTKRPWLLGDVFHSNPIVVPGPQAFLSDDSYKAFQSTYEFRKRIISAGANDGFLRFFDAGTWLVGPGDYDAGTGEELAGFMPYAARQNVKELPNDGGGRSFYYVDGPPSVADVWLYLGNATTNSPQDGSDWDKWRTVTIGGMRQGGNHYYALDITNPAGGCAPLNPSLITDGTGYPCYMWEFPREGAPVADTEFMGQTWSEPVITKIKVTVNCALPDPLLCPQYDRSVAIFTGGYDPTSDPNDAVNYDVQSKAGRSIVVLDIDTGEIIAIKKFDDSATIATTDPAVHPYDPVNPEQSMHYAMPATPGVYDLDFDGYADVIFAPDTGGNVWKWVIKTPAVDPINGGGTTDQNGRWTFTRFFTTPPQTIAGTTYYKSFYFTPSATLKSGKLWLAFGSGERMNLNFAGVAGDASENNRFFAMIDSDPLETTGLSTTITDTGADLLDVTGDSSCADVSTYKGYYFLAEDGEKFVTQSDIFFYYVFVASYKPDTAATPCEASGTAALYAFRVYCGEGLFVDGVGDPESKMDLGSGLPSDPKITIGGGCSGGICGPEANRVIINKQDGSVINIEGPQGFGAGIGQFYWREM